MLQLVSKEKVCHFIATQWDMHDISFTISCMTFCVIFKWWNSCWFYQHSQTRRLQTENDRNQLFSFSAAVCWSPHVFLMWAATWQNQQNCCAPSEDSDQPGHLPSLIRVFAVCMKKPWVLSYLMSGQRRMIRLGRCPGWSEVSLVTHSFCWFCHVAAHVNSASIAM